MNEIRKEMIRKEAGELKCLIDEAQRNKDMRGEGFALLICMSLAPTSFAAIVTESFRPLIISGLIFLGALIFDGIVLLVSFIRAKQGHESDYSRRSQLKRLQGECPHDEPDRRPIRCCSLREEKKLSICPICFKESLVEITKEEDEDLKRPRIHAPGCDPSGMPWDY